MPPLREERTLACPNCDMSDCFVRASGVRQTPSGNLVFPPGGLWCLNCHHPVSVAALLRIEELRRKKEEARQLQAEIEAAEPVGVRALKK